MFGLFRSPAPVVSAALARDAPYLAAIHATGFERSWDALEFERLLVDRTVVCHLARPGGRGLPVAFALSRLVVDEAEVLTVAVVPRARGAGLGRFLLRTHLERLAALGARAIFLEVAEDNRAAVRLYQSLGFEVIGRRQGYYPRRGGEPANALTMRRRLA